MSDNINYDDNKTENLKKSYEEISQFDDLPIDENLLRGIYSLGFEIPSTVQRKAILPILDNRDLIAQSQSGTGKTGTFLIGSIPLVDVTLMEPQILVLCPNRELAKQIMYNFDALNQYTKIKAALIMGGTQVEENFKTLDGGVQYIIGTPGRVYDMMKRYVLKTDNLKCLIMDEADECYLKVLKTKYMKYFSLFQKNAK